MVEHQLRGGGIRDGEILAAFGRVPRERFVPVWLVDRAYDDSALGIGSGQTISQPYMVAVMTDALELIAWKRDHRAARARVLDVGTGSGYQAAILAELDATVVSIERDPALSDAARRRLDALGYGDRIACVVGDGSNGWSPLAPYDGIVVGAAAPDVPEPLLAQLGDGGRLVIPVGRRDRQELRVVRRIGARIEERTLDPCVFVPLVGEHGFRA
jgi:protein-L-isoaspartate(D-aspartate) O-methyltransferase